MGALALGRRVDSCRARHWKYRVVCADLYAAKTNHIDQHDRWCRVRSNSTTRWLDRSNGFVRTWRMGDRRDSLRLAIAAFYGTRMDVPRRLCSRWIYDVACSRSKWTSHCANNGADISHLDSPWIVDDGLWRCRLVVRHHFNHSRMLDDLRKFPLSSSSNRCISTPCVFHQHHISPAALARACA